MAFLTGCSRSPSTAYAVPLAPAPSRAGAFCLERKLCPGIGAQNGMRFPVGASNGKRIPESAPGMGHTFRNSPQPETATRNRCSEWDALSGSAFKRKLHPILSLHSGTRFPQGASSGKRIPFRAPIPGCAFRLSFTWKLRPSLSVYSGMQFPLGVSTGKRVPF